MVIATPSITILFKLIILKNFSDVLWSNPLFSSLSLSGKMFVLKNPQINHLLAKESSEKKVSSCHNLSGYFQNRETGKTTEQQTRRISEHTISTGPNFQDNTPIKSRQIDTAKHPSLSIRITGAHTKHPNCPLKSNVSIKVPFPGKGPDNEDRELFDIYGQIHANHITLPEGPTVAIAAQYPISVTAQENFWRMVSQKNTTLIDLTQKNEPKITPYYPSEIHSSLKVGHITITLTAFNDCMYTYLIEDELTNISSTIDRFHFSGWINKTIIPSDKLHNLAYSCMKFKKLCIHCFGGTGRTMMVYAAMHVLSQMKNQPDLVFSPTNEQFKAELIDKIISDLRIERGTKTLNKGYHKQSLEALFDYLQANPEKFY